MLEILEIKDLKTKDKLIYFDILKPGTEILHLKHHAYYYYYYLTLTQQLTHLITGKPSYQLPV